MSTREPISFEFPCHRLDTLGAYFGLAKTKQSKLETAQAGAVSWSRFIDTRMIAGAGIYIAVNDVASVKTGFDVLNCDWSQFVQAVDPRIWELLTHLKPTANTPPEQMRIRHVEIVAQVALIGSLPFARLHATYPERRICYMEFPKLDLLNDKGQTELPITNEVFEPLFAAHDERTGPPAQIQAVNFKGLINGAS